MSGFLALIRSTSMIVDHRIPYGRREQNRDNPIRQACQRRLSAGKAGERDNARTRIRSD